jgi:hypothetical protein
MRFLLFKLMLLSGYVKLSSGCPTWRDLTALVYHFATQCIPTPLAPFFHSLPLPLLKLGAALTLWIELPIAVAILLPICSVRRVVGFLNISLQLLIALSGNYNFFNLLTIALCLPLLDDKALLSFAPTRILTSLFVDSNSFLAAVDSKPTKHGVVKRSFVVASSLTMLSFFAMFRLGPSFSPAWAVDVDALLKVFSRVTFAAFILSIAYVVFCFFKAFKERPVSGAISLSLVLLYIALCATSMHEVNPALSAAVPPVIRRLGENLRPWMAVNSYGLFRHMTGVGPTLAGEDGQSALSVARPEVVLKGHWDSHNVEIEFL